MPAAKKAKTDGQETINAHVDAREAEYVGRLGEAIAIQSVSAWPHKRDEVRAEEH
jgi:hypothetical protein